jgi:DNA-directed RNA polymerase subunit RPC12/RpoP
MDFVPVAVYYNYIDANIVLGRLQEDGIDCWLKDDNIVTIDPILTNAVGGIKLMVPAGDAMKALQILRDINKEIKAKLSCPKCSSHNVEYVSTPRKVSNWISVLTFGLFASYAPAVQKVYHCFDCGNEFEKPDEKTTEETD